MSNKFCKNKECQKKLPERYKHKYCEACRTLHAQKVKKGLQAVGVVASVVVVAVSGGKIKPKK